MGNASTTASVESPGLTPKQPKIHGNKTDKNRPTNETTKNRIELLECSFCAKLHFV